MYGDACEMSNAELLEAVGDLATEVMERVDACLTRARDGDFDALREGLFLVVNVDDEINPSRGNNWRKSWYYLKDDLEDVAASFDPSEDRSTWSAFLGEHPELTNKRPTKADPPLTFEDADLLPAIGRARAAWLSEYPDSQRTIAEDGAIWATEIVKAIKRRRPRWLSPVTLIVGLALCVCAFAPTAGAQFSASVTIAKKGEAAPAGTAIIQIEVACIGPVLEAFLTLSQDEGAVSGDGPFHPICDGTRRTLDVTVTPTEGRFHKGKAFASAFVLLCDEEGTECASAQDSRVVKLRSASRS